MAIRPFKMRRNNSSALDSSRRERGATAVEYALTVGLVSIGVITATVTLQSKVGGTFTRASAAIGLGGNQKLTYLRVGQPVNVFDTRGVGASIADWVVTSGNVDVIGNNYWNSPAGDGSLDMNGSQMGTVSQTFPTAPGQRYRFSYYSGGNVDGADSQLVPVKTMTVTVGGQTRNESFDVRGKSLANMGWELKTIEFTATAGETTATFQSTTIDPCGCQGSAITGMTLEII